MWQANVFQISISSEEAYSFNEAFFLHCDIRAAVIFTLCSSKNIKNKFNSEIKNMLNMAKLHSSHCAHVTFIDR